MINVGFIGLGRMGRAICSTLLKNNIDLYIYNRTKSKANSLLEQGAHWCESIKSVSNSCEIIFICLSNEDAIDGLLLSSEHGLLTQCTSGSIIIDTSTISPTKAESNYLYSRQYGIEYVSCPVSGGVVGASNSTLAAIVASSLETRIRIEPLVGLFANRITWLNDNAQVQKLKILNNLAESINLLGAIEVLTLGLFHGIDLESLNSVLTTCRGRSAYMDVAIDYLKTGLSPSEVSLAVRCKDLNLSQSLISDNSKYIMSNKANEIFNLIMEQYGAEADQCEYLNFINKDEKL